MNALTMKNAQALANDFINAQTARDTITGLLTTSYNEHLDGNAKATKFIIEQTKMTTLCIEKN